MKKKRGILLIVVILLLGGMLFFLGKGKNKEAEPIPNKKSGVTTVMIHGTPSDEHVFDRLTKELEEKGGTKEPLLIVSRDGEIQLDGKWKPAKYPLVQVRFSYNDAPDALQAEWLSRVFSWLQEHKVSAVDYIAHSQGGVALAFYLAQQQYKQEDPIQLQKVVTLGSPYNELGKQVDKDDQLIASSTLKTVEKGFSEHKIQCGPWLNIAGEINATDDGIVPIESVKSLDTILDKEGIKNQFLLLSDLGHNDLPIDSLVFEEINKFLVWPEKKVEK